MKNIPLKSDMVQFLRKRMDEGKGGSSIRDIVRSTRKFGKTEDIESLLISMVGDGLVYSLNCVHNGPGRPVMKYYVSDTAESKLAAAPVELDAFPVNTVETDDELSIAYYGEKWLSKDEIVDHLGVDMAIWRIDKVEYRGWEVTGKMHQGQIREEGTVTWLPQKLWKSKNRYIALRLVRRAPKNVQDGVAALLARGEWPKAPTPVVYNSGSAVMELSLYDVHLGKYCWGKHTGESYDNDIAATVFMQAGYDLLKRTSHLNIDHIVIPIGHDFFQVDNWIGATTAGTIVESTDTRFSKTFQIGADSFVFLIDECLKVAPVELLWVPGNHDMSTSFYLTQVINAYYHANKHVQVDSQFSTGHKGRKYRRFGVTFLGYVHGGQRDCPKDRDLPLLMATEEPDQWAASTDRAWRLGHLHTKRTSVVPVGDIFNGVRVERIPSLSATDAWHYDNGFTGNRRAAEAWVWSYTDGLIDQMPSYAVE